MTTQELLDLKEFILFAKSEKIPSFKMGAFECSLPPKDANESALEAMRKDIEALKSICNRLIMAAEVKERGNPYTPFTQRINAVAKNG